MIVYSPHAVLDKPTIAHYENLFDVQSVGNKVFSASLVGGHSGTSTDTETILDLDAPYDYILLDWRISISPHALSTLTSGMIQLSFYTAGINQNPFTSNGTSTPFDSRYLHYEAFSFQNSRFVEAGPNYIPRLIRRQDKLTIAATIMATGGAATAYQITTGVNLVVLPVVIK